MKVDMINKKIVDITKKICIVMYRKKSVPVVKHVNLAQIDLSQGRLPPPQG